MTVRSAVEPMAVRSLILQHPHIAGDELRSELRDVTSANLARMRAHGNIVGLRFAHLGFVYPAFQFDRSRLRVHPAVTRLHRVLLAQHPVEDVIAWWLTPHPRLDELPAQSLTRGEDLLEAVSAGITHLHLTNVSAPDTLG